MKRFAFRLERLRELRERAERARAAELGEAMREEQARQAALEHARLELERNVTQAALLPGSGTVTAGLLQNLERARSAAEGRVDAAAESLRGANARVGDERELYGLARRDLKVVERLKERRYDAWREAGARADRVEADETAQQRHHHHEERP